MRRRSLPVLRYPIASSRYRKPRSVAGRRKRGNTALQVYISIAIHVQFQATYVTVRMEAKKLAIDELTAWSEPAKEVSMVSIS